MKVSEYIKHLQNLQKLHGDLPLYHFSCDQIGETSTPPTVKNLRILNKRERRKDYWEDWRSCCTPENKGEKVIAI